MVQREHHLPNTPITIETAYFSSSLPGDAAYLLKIIRSRRVLDMAFREDDAKLHKEDGDQNFAVLQQLVLNLLKQDSTVKLAVKDKRLKTGWDEAYLRHILASAI